MTNAKKFEQIFGIYATELWAMQEEEFLAWLNAEAKTEDWIPCSERLPDDDGEYLITEKYSNAFPPIISLVQFSNDLYKVDWHDFRDKKGKAGFYQYDSEWGYVEVSGVIAWQKTPKPYKEK